MTFNLLYEMGPTPWHWLKNDPAALQAAFFPR
jgi:hypothetical protein